MSKPLVWHSPLHERPRPGSLRGWPGRVRSDFHSLPVATLVRPAGLPLMRCRYRRRLGEVGPRPTFTSPPAVPSSGRRGFLKPRTSGLSPAQHGQDGTRHRRPLHSGLKTAPDLPDASVLGQIVDDRPAMRLDDPFDLGPSVLAKSPRENDPPPAAHHLTASWCQGDVGITHIEALPQIRLGRRGGVLIGKRSCQDMHRR